MKKLIAFAAVISLATSLFAYNMSAGIRLNGGTNILTSSQKIKYANGDKQTKKYNSDFGGTFGLGGVFTLDFTKQIAVSAEMIFRPLNKTKSTAESLGIPGIDAKADINFKTLEFPILFQYRFPLGPGKLVGTIGPTINFICGDVDASATVMLPFIGPYTMDMSSSPKDLDMYVASLGGLIGAEYHYPFGPGFIEAGLKTYFDITNWNKNTNEESKTYTRRFGIVLDAGYSLKF